MVELLPDILSEDVWLGLIVTWCFFGALLIGRYVRMRQRRYTKR